MVDVYVPMLPEPDDEEQDDDLIAVDLFTDVSLEGVTSGADSSSWDPIEIETEHKRSEDESEDEDVLDADLTDDSQPAGVTSGTDSVIEGDVKSSQRKHKQPN